MQRIFFPVTTLGTRVHGALWLFIFYFFYLTATAHSVDSSHSLSSALRPTAVRPRARGQSFRHRPARPHPPVHVIHGRRASYGRDSALSAEERQRCAPGRRSAVRAGLRPFRVCPPPPLPLQFLSSVQSISLRQSQ